MWRDFDCSTATRVHIALYKEVLDPFGLSQPTQHFDVLRPQP